MALFCSFKAYGERKTSDQTLFLNSGDNRMKYDVSIEVDGGDVQAKRGSSGAAIGRNQSSFLSFVPKGS